MTSRDLGLLLFAGIVAVALITVVGLPVLYHQVEVIVEFWK